MALTDRHLLLQFLLRLFTCTFLGTSKWNRQIQKFEIQFSWFNLEPDCFLDFPDFTRFGKPPAKIDATRHPGRLPFARLEWSACNGTGLSWLTLNRSAGPRWPLPAVLFTMFTITRAYFRPLYATKRTSWLLKLFIYSPVQSWFRNSEVLCKIASHTVHCHAAEAAILKNPQRKAEKGAEVNRAEWEFTKRKSDFPVIPVGTGKEEYVWRFPSFSETIR